MGRFVDWLVPSGGVAVGLTVVAAVLSFGPIAEDVSGRAREALKAEGRNWAVVTIDGRDVTLSGIAPDPASVGLASEATDRVFGVRVVDAGAVTVVALADPFTFSATRDGDKLTLTGNVPSEAARKALLDWAKKAMPTITVDDRTTLARGAPAIFPAAAAFAVGQVADLKKGAASLSATAYTIAGDPADWATYGRLETALKQAMPAGLSLAADKLVAPIPSPYRFGLSTAGKSATIDGYLPDAAAKAAVLDALKARFTGGVTDRVEVVPGAPPGYVEAILKTLGGLSRLSDPGFDLSGATLSIRGGALTEAIGRQVLDRLKSLLPAGVTLAAGGPTVLPPPPQVDAATCQAALARVQSGEKIHFATGKADLDQRSIGVLDALVGGALGCLSAHIAIEGHTDSDGAPEANQALSEARAKAVLDYLVAAGIAADRLTSAGFGETRPIAPNDTAEGKQMNRRIDFRVE